MSSGKNNQPSNSNTEHENLVFGDASAKVVRRPDGRVGLVVTPMGERGVAALSRWALHELARHITDRIKAGNATISVTITVNVDVDLSDAAHGG